MRCCECRCDVIFWTGTQRCSWRGRWPATRFRSYHASTLSSWSSPATTTRHWGTTSRRWRGTRHSETTMRHVLAESLAWPYAPETYDGITHCCDSSLEDCVICVADVSLKKICGLSIRNHISVDIMKELGIEKDIVSVLEFVTCIFAMWLA